MTIGLAQRSITAVRQAAPMILAATGMPGVIVAVTDRDGAEAAAFGLADRDTPLAVTDTLRIGSAGKPPAALLAMRNAERGVSLDEPVRLGWELENPLGGSEITPRLLISHRAGLRVDTIAARWVTEPPRSEWELVEVGRSPEFGGARSLWVDAAGQRMVYSSLGTQLAIRHGAVVTGTPYDVAVQAVAPGLYDPDLGGARPLRGFMVFGGTFARFPVEITTDLPGAAGMAASMPTLAAAYRGLLTKDEGGSGVVSDESVTVIRTPTARYDLFGQPTPYLAGLGVQIGGMGTETYNVGHEGCFPFGSWVMARAYPRYGMTLAIGLPYWRMPGWYNPPGAGPIGLLRQLVEAVALERPVHQVRAGFGAGLAMAHHARLLGLGGPLREPELWRPFPGRSPVRGDGLVPAHVAEGLAAMDGAMTPGEVEERLADHLVGLSRLAVEWGVRDLALPHPTYAGRGGG